MSNVFSVFHIWITCLWNIIYLQMILNKYI